MIRLSDEEVNNLVAESQKGNEEAKNALYLQYKTAIWKVLHSLKLKYDRDYMEELYQYGCEGFVKAVNKFDVSLGFKFYTYLVHKVRGEILRRIRDCPSNSSMPRLNREINELGSKLVRESGSTGISIFKLLDEGDYSYKEKFGVKVYLGKIASIDEKINPNEDLTIADTLVDKDETFVIDTFHFTEEMPENEKVVLKYKYEYGYSQREIGMKMGYSQAHISRIDTKLQERLRDYYFEEKVSI